ncbi:hypothetical protein BJY04DRAFT_142027 [Aspergillus karnatakaensis]|uniref:Zn(II)2Cys6 transcription factor domain-containing protein n=1 Tax=Aspergillus karnatakaensis TaxID=1810916 RepID=UPI003CCE04C1
MAPDVIEPKDSNERSGSSTLSLQSRSRKGCITCRIRRVKCDEERPHCRRCQSTGRRCDGYVPPPPPEPARQQPLGQQQEMRIIQHTPQVTQPTQLRMFPGVDSLLAEDEYRSLEFFNLQTASCFGSRAGGWLLNAACQDPAIRLAAMALGTMHRVVLYHSRTPPHDRARGMQYALQQYNSAIRQGLKLFAGNSDASADGILAMCVLFFSFDSLQGHFRSALQHVGSGLRILDQRQRRGQPAEYTLLPPDVIHSLFATLEAQVLEIDGQSPLLDDNGLSVRAANGSPGIWMLEQAHDTFQTIYNNFLRALSLLGRFEDPPGESGMMGIIEQLMARKQQVHTELNAWSLEFDHFINHIFNWDSADHASQQSVRMLQLWRNMLTMVLHMDWPPQDTAWESHLPQLNTILDLAEQIIVMSLPVDLELSATCSIFTSLGPSCPCSPGDPRSRSTSTSSSASPEGSPPPPPSQAHPTSSYPPLLPRPDPQPSTLSRFTVSLGLIPALWTIANQCRDSTVRYRAINLIRRSKRREGVWDSDLHSRLALRIARREEQAAGLQEGAVYTHANIPPEARVTLDGRFVEGRKAKIRYMREKVRVGEEVFYW